MAKNLIKNAALVLTDYENRYEWIINKKTCLGLPYDKELVKLQYKKETGRKLNLRHPKRFNEKLNWLKLYYRRNIMTVLVDKYAVRSYVEDKIGKEFLVPLLGVYNRFEEIDFNELPDSFVMKCNHDSHSVIICNNKAELDVEKAKEKLNKHLSINYGEKCAEWPYKNIERKIIIEELIEDPSGEELKDYKFFCFDGVPKILFVKSHDSNGTYIDYYDKEFIRMPISRYDFPNSKSVISKPKNFNQMKSIARVLSEGFPHVRVDLYEVNSKIYFGEMTFYVTAGYGEMRPDKWNEILGSWIVLPQKTIEN